MKILALDTATTTLSVAITEGETIRAEVILKRDETHSKHLMRAVGQVLDLTGFSLSDVDGYALTKGPGSFTGVRIGMSAVKGFVVADEKPVVAISCLDVLAHQGAACGFETICPIMDARRGEVYFARYRNNGGVIENEVGGRVIDIHSALAGISGVCLFIGNGAALYQSDIKSKLGDLAHVAAPFQHTLRASALAHLSLARFEKGDIEDVATLKPDYIRKADAQIHRQAS